MGYIIEKDSSFELKSHKMCFSYVMWNRNVTKFGSLYQVKLDDWVIALLVCLPTTWTELCTCKAKAYKWSDTVQIISCLIAHCTVSCNSWFGCILHWTAAILGHLFEIERPQIYIANFFISKSVQILKWTDKTESETLIMHTNTFVKLSDNKQKELLVRNTKGTTQKNDTSPAILSKLHRWGVMQATLLLLHPPPEEIQ